MFMGLHSGKHTIGGGEGDFFSKYYSTQIWYHKLVCRGKGISVFAAVN